MGNPRVIVQVKGGLVQWIGSDTEIDIDVLDWDDYNDEDCDEERKKELEELDKESDGLTTVY